MPRSGSYFTLLALAAILSACGSTQYYMEFMVPSERYIPPRVQRLLAVNRAAPEGKYTRVPTLEATVRDLRNLNIVSANAALYELMQIDTVLMRYEWATAEPVKIPREKSSYLADTLSQEQMTDLCSNYDVDAIVSIDGMETRVKLNRETDFSQGYPRLFQWFTVDQRVDWRFYDCQKMFVGDEYTDNVVEVVYEDELAELPVEGNMPPAQEVSLYAGQIAAGKYYERIAPHWRGEYRKLFVDGSERIEDAAFQVLQNNDLDKAIGIWKKVIRDGSTKEKRRAYYNLALASEIKGKPEIGLEWIEQGVNDVGEHTTLTEYRSLLRDQVKELNLIERQLGY